MTAIDALLSSVGAAAVLPAVLLLWLVIAADKRPEPPAVIWIAFLLGAASLWPLEYWQSWSMPEANTPDANTYVTTWLAVVRQAFLRISVPEETVKILTLCLVSVRRRPFEDPMDTVVYGVAVGLGFAAHENLYYLSRPTDDWYALAVVRGLLTVPFHAALGAIAGAYLAAARFGSALGAHQHGHLARARLVISMWLIPVVLHALFDLQLLQLRQSAHDAIWSSILQVISGLVIGLGSIVLGAHLIIKIDKHHHPLPGSTRASAIAWRAIWAFLLAGGVATFLGATLLITAARGEIVIGGNLLKASILGGIFLVVTGGALFWWAQRHLRGSAYDAVNEAGPFERQE